MENIIWLGGSPDSGKTSIAKELVRKYNLEFYHYDKYENEHHQKMTQHSEATGEVLSSSPEDSWVHTTPEALLNLAEQSIYGRFPHVLEDLSTYSLSSLILVEGFGLTPQLVHPYLVNSRQAIWLVTSDELKRKTMPREKKMSGVFYTHEMEQLAEENMLQRDLLIGKMIVDQANALDLPVLEVNERTSIDQIQAEVENHFEPFLSGADS